MAQKTLFGKKLKEKRDAKKEAERENKRRAEEAERQMRELREVFATKLDGRKCARCKTPAYSHTHLFMDGTCEKCAERGF